MRFIHAADIHLDSPLTGLAAYPDAPAELLRTATRDAFANLVTAAIEEKVDFMVIAGDLYDGNWKDFNTGIFFSGQMGRLKVAGIPVYLLYGNHDADSEMTKTLSLPDNVHRFPSNKAGTFRLPELKVALHGRSFKDAATTENLAVNYPDPVAGWLNIGVLHTALEGNASHANYAPCSIAELEARGYQYWALGHVHEHRIWRGESVIAFPGNLQGRHIRESGPRGALMVTAEGTDIVSVERLHVDVLRWHALEVDVAAAANLNESVRLIGRGLEQLIEESGALPLVVRVTLTGASPAHGELFGLETQLRAEVLAHAASIGSERLWIEKVRLDTSPHDLAADVTARSDAVADLQALLLKAEFDPIFMKSLEEDLMQLIGKLPLEVIDALASVKSVREGQTDSLVRSIGPALLDHVAKAG
jgi:DNA repair exonuclease SbcCD nuclease subunit